MYKCPQFHPPTSHPRRLQRQGSGMQREGGRVQLSNTRSLHCQLLRLNASVHNIYTCMCRCCRCETCDVLPTAVAAPRRIRNAGSFTGFLALGSLRATALIRRLSVVHTLEDTSSCGFMPALSARDRATRISLRTRDPDACIRGLHARWFTSSIVSLPVKVGIAVFGRGNRRVTPT